MKKIIIIGFTVILTISIVILVACCGTTLFCGGKHINNSSKITEEIIECKIPEGFIPIHAMKMSNNQLYRKDRISILSNLIHTIVLVEGPQIKTENDKQYFLDNFKKGFRKSNRGPFKKELSINHGKDLIINGKKYLNFSILMHSRGRDITGTGVFLDYPTENKTVLFVCIADKYYYDPNIATKFLQQILKNK